MLKRIIYKSTVVAALAFGISACSVPALVERTAQSSMPKGFQKFSDTTNTANLRWNEYFTDPNLIALIDTALKNNQELNIMLQEIAISQNEVLEKKGEYLPFLGLKAGAEIDKVGRYTRAGAVEKNLEIEEGKEFPEPLTDLMVGAFANWEIDAWHKLRNAKKAAVTRYLASIEGRNFMVTNLISEIANAYYELLALDNQLNIVNQNIRIQSNALEIVKLQKQAAKATELAVRKFEAEVLKTRSLQFEIRQRIVETENEINYLLGRYPQTIPRNSAVFNGFVPTTIQSGIPTQLLENRPDVRQAELVMEAARIDVNVARAQFYPSLGISAGIGYQAYNAKKIISTPESMLFSLAGDLMAPLINRNAIKANFKTANAKQIQAIYEYEQTVLNAYVEVANQLSNIHNLEQSIDLKEQQVEALTESINISNDLFRSARADYMEVLLTQRDALESRFELVETKMAQMHAVVNIYQALGGGWN